MHKLTPIAALVAVAALALPVASWADDGTPAQPSQGSRVARIQERLQKVEARIEAASQKIADLQAKLGEKCTAAPTTPAPATGTDQGSTPNRADRCARAQARLERAQDRLQKAKDRLAKLEARVQQWLRSHNGQDGGSPLSPADQAALGQLQQQLAGLNA